MKRTIYVTQQTTILLHPSDGQWVTAAVETVTFESSDEGVATVTQDGGNPLQAVVAAVAPGTCTITASADAVIGGGETIINDVLDLTVCVAGVAVRLGLVAGPPEAQ